MEFITEKLEIEIPLAYQNPTAFNKFVNHRILNFKTSSVNLDHPIDLLDDELD
jgi:hypothetical protein